MKLSANLLYLFAALIAVTPSQVAADNGDGDDNGSGVGDSSWKPQPPRPSPLYHDRPDRPGQPNDGKPWNPDHKKPEVQVLWGQCGGYYYYGTDKCPEGSYCRYFSDWYSQCNPNNN